MREKPSTGALQTLASWDLDGQLPCGPGKPSLLFSLVYGGARCLAPQDGPLGAVGLLPELPTVVTSLKQKKQAEIRAWLL